MGGAGALLHAGFELLVERAQLGLGVVQFRVVPLALYDDERLTKLLATDLRLDRSSYRQSIKRMMRVFFTRREQGKDVLDVYKYKRGVLQYQADGTLPTEPIWEAFSSHNARKTFCTIMFLKGYTVEMVGKIIGSKREDVLKDTYIKYMDSDLDKQIKQVKNEQALRETVA